MKYRAILDEELKPMNEPPSDKRQVVVYSKTQYIHTAFHTPTMGWAYIEPNDYIGWTECPRLEEVK